MNASSDSVFYYRAHANAFGGTFRQPLVREVSTRASASLASAGGYQHVTEEKFAVDGLMSVERAYVRVYGSEHTHKQRVSATEWRTVRSWRTVSSAVIEGLNILDVITADRIVAQITVDHPEGGIEPTITLQTSRYESLLINGAQVSVTLEPGIFGPRKAQAGQKPVGPRNFSDLKAVACTQYNNRNAKTGTNPVFDRLKKFDPDTDLLEKGSALCSLVQDVDPHGHFESLGHMLHVPDFGNVFLGEMLISRSSAQLTMLRVEMGCMAEGELSGCSTFSNGRPMP
jgi:hypothetical protein